MLDYRESLCLILADLLKLIHQIHVIIRSTDLNQEVLNILYSSLLKLTCNSLGYNGNVKKFT